MYLAIKNPFRYRSYYYDVETGLYYLNSRYYDPRTGRFINADDIEILDKAKEFINGLNLYAYCLNNPVNDKDSNGDLSWWQWLLFGIGAVLVVAAAVVVTVASGGAALGAVATVVAGAAKGVLIGAAVGTALGAAGGAVYSAVTGHDMLDSIVTGIAIGFGIGAIAGALIGGAVGAFSYTATGLSRTAVKQAVKVTLKDANKMHHIMQPKHNLPNSINEIGKLMQKTLIKGKFTPYKSVSSAVWKNHQVTYNIVKDVIKISDMWLL